MPENNSWSLRDEILHHTHRWPHILLVCLAGCALGWIISWLWPTSYQASIELYVGLGSWDIVATLTPEQLTAAESSPVQTGSLEFKDVIDYKNWQMMNLNGLVFMDQTLNNALSQLQAQDEYWNQVTPAQLNAILSAHWRSAGKWRLVAIHHEPLRASQAAFAWQKAIIEQTNLSIEAARRLRQLTPQIQENAIAYTQLQQKLAALTHVQQAIADQLASLRSLPQNQPLAELDRWLIWQIVMQAELGPTWLPLIDAFPASSLPASNYAAWLQKAAQAIEEEIQLIQGQSNNLEAQNQMLSDQYTQALETSLGLSANLEVRTIQNKTPQELQLCATANISPGCGFLSPSRPTGTLMLVSAGLALLTWFMIWTIRLALQEKE